MLFVFVHDKNMFIVNEVKETLVSKVELKVKYESRKSTCCVFSVIFLISQGCISCYNFCLARVAFRVIISDWPG